MTDGLLKLDWLLLGIMVGAGLGWLTLDLVISKCAKCDKDDDPPCPPTNL